MFLCHRFISIEDKTWFEECIKRVLKSSTSEEYVPMVAAESYFVNFLREAPEPTGEEGEDASLESPKVYEPVCYSTVCT